MQIDKRDPNFVYFWVGKNIRKYRKLKGWSQSKLASECSYTTSFISCLENNAFQTLSLNSLYHISMVLDIHIKQLFDDLEEDKKNIEWYSYHSFIIYQIAV